MAWPRRSCNTPIKRNSIDRICPVPHVRRLTARGPVHRCVETMVGTIERAALLLLCGLPWETYPLDEVLDVSAGRIQRDVQRAAVDLATEVPYETASTLLSRLVGLRSVVSACTR